jgi:ribosomal protein L12E/L44/L45/RPP1/RPP2
MTQLSQNVRRLTHCATVEEYEQRKRLAAAETLDLTNVLAKYPQLLGKLFPPKPSQQASSDNPNGNEPPDPEEDEEKEKDAEGEDDEEFTDDDGEVEEGDQEVDKKRKSALAIAKKMVRLGARMRAEPAPKFVRIQQPKVRAVPRSYQGDADTQSVALACVNAGRKARGEPELKRLDPRVGGR